MHTAVALRLAKAVFMVCAVEVNVAGIAVASGTAVAAGFEAAQPEDARGDQVFFTFLLREFREMPVCAFPV